MPSYTTSLRLIQPATGEYSGTWGTQVNNGITALVDAAVAGTASITMTAANYTLSNNNGASDEARAMFLVLQGTPGASYFVIVPTVSKLYFVTNNTGFAQRISTSTTPGSGISVPNGASMTLRCDGTNVVEALNAFGSLTINTGKVVLPNTQSYAIRTNSGVSCDVVTLTSGNVLQLGGGGATDSVQFWNQGLERMRLDSSGNLGLGVTPSAWTGSGGKNIEVGATGNALFGSASLTSYTSNANFDSSWKYSRTGFASRYEQQDSNHRWFTAPSWNGTGSDIISFTQAMTLDASGNLGIGISSPQAVLHVNKATTSTFRLSATNVGIDIQSLDSAGYGLVATYTNHPMVFSTNATERMRLDASGNLGLGVTPSAWSGVVAMQLPTGAALTGFSNTTNLVQNAYYDGSWRYISAAPAAAALAQVTQGAHQWFTAPSGTAGNTISFTQAMTLDASGDLLVGTTGSYSGNGSRQTVCYDGAGTKYGITLNAVSVTTNATAISFLVNGTTSGSGGTAVGSVTCSGSATAYNTSSDYRLKDNPQPLTGSGAFIDALQPKTWEWKTDGTRGVGFIAHEAQVVSPSSVVGEKDAVDADGKPVMQAMEYGSAEFIANIIAELQSLRARVAALEAA